MNKVVLVGRLTKEPELKYTPGTGMAVTTITLAVDRYNASTKQKEADFIQCVIWGKQAEATATYMGKGSLMGVVGRITTRSYDAKDGTKRYVTEVVVSETSFLSSKKTDQGGPFGGSGDGFSPAQNPFGGSPYDQELTPVDDDDIPF